MSNMNLDFQAVKKLFKVMSSPNHFYSTFWTVTYLSVTSLTHKMSLRALENITISRVSLITDGTFRSFNTIIFDRISFFLLSFDIQFDS